MGVCVCEGSGVWTDGLSSAVLERCDLLLFGFYLHMGQHTWPHDTYVLFPVVFGPISVFFHCHLFIPAVFYI